MIRLFPIGAFDISPGETPASIRQSLMTAWGINFISQIQEMKTGRFLHDDETLVDDREYYIVFDYDLPPKSIFKEPIVGKGKYERIE